MCNFHGKYFFTKNFNGDLFGSLKKITGVSSSHGPPPSLSFDGATPLEPNQILLAFSSWFFTNALPNSPLQDNLKKYVLSRFAEQAPSFMLISQAKILNAFDSLKPNQSSGTDGCPAEWLKCCSTLISSHLTALFNSCLSAAYFPDEWRIVKVIILRKPNKSQYPNPSSFRPISILCALSNVFERILHSRLKAIAESPSGPWFSDNQHGFIYKIAPRNLPAQRWPASLKEILKRNFLLAVPSSISKVPSTPLGNRGFYMVFCANCPIYLVKILSSFLNARKAKL
jgi:hypothetical protein